MARSHALCQASVTDCGTTARTRSGRQTVWTACPPAIGGLVSATRRSSRVIFLFARCFRRNRRALQPPRAAYFFCRNISWRKISPSDKSRPHFRQETKTPCESFARGHFSYDALCALFTELFTRSADRRRHCSCDAPPRGHGAPLCDAPPLLPFPFRTERLSRPLYCTPLPRMRRPLT